MALMSTGNDQVVNDFQPGWGAACPEWANLTLGSTAGDFKDFAHPSYHRRPAVMFVHSGARGYPHRSKTQTRNRPTKPTPWKRLKSDRETDRPSTERTQEVSKSDHGKHAHTHTASDETDEEVT